MKLSHLNLTVHDVDVAVRFLKTYFDMKCGMQSDTFALLYGYDGQFLLSLMKGKNVQYPKTFHIGFAQNTREDVDRIYERLKKDGYDVSTPVERHGYTFYVQSPGGFNVEVTKW